MAFTDSGTLPRDLSEDRRMPLPVGHCRPRTLQPRWWSFSPVPFRPHDDAPRPFALVPAFDGAGSCPETGHLPVLGQGLMDIMAVAGLNAVTPLNRAHWGWNEQATALVAAASRFTVYPGITLDTILWTGAHNIAGAAMRQALPDLSDRHRRNDIPGFLITLATIANKHGAFFARQRPLRPAQGLSGIFAAGGPYLILLEYRHDPLGILRATDGFAQPVLDSRSLIPVGSDFERDVLKLLLAVQDRLDDHGCNLVIERGLSIEGLAPFLEISVAACGHDNRPPSVSADCACPENCAPCESVVVATPDGMADGTLSRFLCEKSVQGTPFRVKFA